MDGKSGIFLTWSLALMAAVICHSNALGEDGFIDPDGSRFELWAGPTAWPALTDLDTVTGDSFDSAGFGIGGAIHVPVRHFAASDLLVGVDASIAATDSNIRGTVETLALRHLYIGPSVKWRFGDARNLALDFGVGYHLADMAQVDTNYWYSYEFQSWEASSVGAMLGATWDIGAGRPTKSGGLFLGFKVHFVDFGDVHDEDVLGWPLLGSNAGRLNGPLYLFQIGYSGY